MTSQKKHNNVPVTNPKDVEICDLSDKEFQNSHFKELNELQENTERQFHEIRKTTHRQNEKFNKERNHKKEPNKFWS